MVLISLPSLSLTPLHHLRRSEKKEILEKAQVPVVSQQAAPKAGWPAPAEAALVEDLRLQLKERDAQLLELYFQRLDLESEVSSLEDKMLFMEKRDQQARKGEGRLAKTVLRAVTEMQRELRLAAGGECKDDHEESFAAAAGTAGAPRDAKGDAHATEALPNVLLRTLTHVRQLADLEQVDSADVSPVPSPLCPTEGPSGSGRHFFGKVEEGKRKLSSKLLQRSAIARAALSFFGGSGPRSGDSEGGGSGSSGGSGFSANAEEAETKEEEAAATARASRCDSASSCSESSSSGGICDALESFESEVVAADGQADAPELLHYHILANTYLFRTQSAKGTAPVDSAEALLELKNRYLAATGLWLRTDSVSADDLRAARQRVLRRIADKHRGVERAAATAERAVARAEAQRLESESESEVYAERQDVISVLSSTVELLRWRQVLQLLEAALEAATG